MKPRPVRQLNLQDLIKRKALQQSAAISDTDIQTLLVTLLYDLPDDTEGNATRARVKLDILNSLHKINLDNKPQQQNQAGSLDAALEAHLRSKDEERRAQEEARHQARTQASEVGSKPEAVEAAPGSSNTNPEPEAAE